MSIYGLTEENYNESVDAIGLRACGGCFHVHDTASENYRGSLSIVKVKVSLERAMKAKRGSRGIALDEGGGQLHV
jgi:hypothetical protein